MAAAAITDNIIINSNDHVLCAYVANLWTFASIFYKFISLIYTVSISL